MKTVAALCLLMLTGVLTLVAMSACFAFFGAESVNHAATLIGSAIGGVVVAAILFVFMLKL